MSWVASVISRSMACSRAWPLGRGLPPEIEHDNFASIVRQVKSHTIQIFPLNLRSRLAYGEMPEFEKITSGSFAEGAAKEVLHGTPFLVLDDPFRQFLCLLDLFGNRCLFNKTHGASTIKFDGLLTSCGAQPDDGENEGES